MTKTLPHIPENPEKAAEIYIDHLINGRQVCDEYDIEWHEFDQFMDRMASAAGKSLLAHFIFTMHSENGEISIALTPEKYFDQNGFLYDQHLYHLYDYMPSNFDEVMEATWVVQGAKDIQSVYDQMVGLGVRWSEKAQALVDRHSNTPLLSEISSFSKSAKSDGRDKLTLYDMDDWLIAEFKKAAEPKGQVVYNNHPDWRDIMAMMAELMKKNPSPFYCETVECPGPENLPKHLRKHI